MKKSIRISIVVLLVFAIAVTAFITTRAGSAMAAGSICPNVGWNSRSFSCLSVLPLDSINALAYVPGSIPQPAVGWNS